MIHRFIFLAFAAFLAGPAPVHAQEMPVDADFGTGPETEEILPPGWREDSRSRFEPELESLEGQGRTYLRVHYEGRDRGPLALQKELPQHDRESFFKATLDARAATSSQRVRIAIRTRTRPHTHLAEHTFTLGSEWEQIEIEMPNVPVAEERIEFILELPAPGTIDLAGVRLERRDRTAVVSEHLSDEPDRTMENLLRITRFPLGLQPGMTLDRNLCDLDQVQVSPDPGREGPSGSPALRIESDERFTLYFPPFAIPLAFDRHRATLSVRGEGKGRLVIMGGSDILAEEDFVARPARWTRVETAFHPSENVPFHALRLEGSGRVWVDALQVSHGDRDTRYESRGEGEVALAVPEGDASAARILFEDEEPRIDYAVTGNGTRATLRTRLHNLYGETEDLPEIDVNRAFLQAGEIAVDRFPDRPFGTFRLEAWLENERGRETSPRYELVFHRLKRPRAWGEDAPDSAFGIHTNPTRRHLVMAKAVGINWVRLHDAGLPFIGWYHLEREPGEWTFHDDEIERYRDHHMSILGSLSTAPEWASHLSQINDSYWDRFYQPKEPARFAEYATKVAERYRDSIRHYEIWNEPWHRDFWSVDWSGDNPGRGYVTSDHPASDYVQLKKTAHAAVKAVDAEIQIIGVNTAGFDRGQDWTRHILSNNGLDATDIIGYHQHVHETAGYPGDRVEEGNEMGIGPIRREINGASLPPVWLKEGGAGRDRIKNGFYEHTLPFDEDEDPVDVANRTVRYTLSALAQGVEKVFLYTMHGHRFFGGGGGWRSLVTEEGYLHPAGAAYSALTWQLEGLDFTRRLELQDDAVFAFLFEGDESSVATVVRHPDRDISFTLPADRELKVFDFLNNPLEPASELGETPVYLRLDGPTEKLEEKLSGR